MRLIGYWIGSLLDGYVPPQALVGGLTEAARSTVAAYLDAGEEWACYRGSSWCRFGCRREMGNRELSDGRWVWPEDLGHYVREHGVRLPEEFVTEVMRGVVPSPKEKWAATTSPDESFWREWCWRNVPAGVRRHLADARAAADVEADRLRSAAVAALEAEHGIGSETCQWAGCQGRVLKGRVLCGRCTMKGEHDRGLSAYVVGPEFLATLG
jgi:hypothetical protein